MSALNPKSFCRLRRVSGRDLYGRASHGPEKTVRCAIVHAGYAASRTDTRDDKSASRGAIEEIVGDARLLFEPETEIDEGDLIKVQGLWFQVKAVMLRPDVHGSAHHKQVEADRWASA